MMKQKNKWFVLTAMLMMCMGLGGCGLTEATNNEIRDDYTPEEQVVILPESSSEYTGKLPRELSGMELAIENEYLAMYFGEDFQFAVYNKTDGSVRYSNEVYNLSTADYNTIPESVKKTLQSQVMIEYYTTDLAKFKMSSYPDAKSSIKDQIWMEVNEDNTVTVTYGLGTNFDQSTVFASLTQETYDKYDAKLNEMMDAGEISRLDYRDFVNNYTKIVYDKLSELDKASYTETYPNLPELGIIYIVKPLKVNNVIEKIAEVYDILGITKEEKIAEAEKIGSLKGDLDFTYFEITVTYSLEGMDLVVKCDISDVYVSGKEYLTRIYLLPCFAASNYTQEGYLFVPDGSGCIVENGISNNSMTNMSVSFYGYDYGLDYSDYSELGLSASFPVFGVKSNEYATFAVVENGAAMGGVTAQVQQSKFGYNLLYPYFEYEIIDDFGVEGVSYAFYENPANADYVVRYHMMSGEDSDYSAMARYYAQYLTQKGVFADKADSAAPAVEIELIGSIDKTVNYIGVPIDSEYVLTDFEDAYEITSLLKEQGVDDLSLIYKAMMNGGYYYKSPSKVKVSSKLGGEKGFNELQEKLTQMDTKLAATVDFIKIYEKGNGITDSDDVVQYLKKSTAFLSKLNPASLNRSYSGAAYLVSPKLYCETAESFIKEYDLSSEQLYLSSVGSILCGNYDVNEGMTRNTARIYQEELLGMLSEAGFALKLDGANEYALAYADSLTNVPTSSSHQRLESYSIPFVGMVLKGNIPFTCDSINQENNPDKSLLQAVESGAGYHFLLMHANQLELQDTDQADLFSVTYELWLDYIVESYRERKESLGALEDCRIYSHERITEDVNMVTYEDGTRVYVNYGDQVYESKDGTVSPMSYMVAGK